MSVKGIGIVSLIDRQSDKPIYTSTGRFMRIPLTFANRYCQTKGQQPFLLNHKPALEIGKVDNFFISDDALYCEFTIADAAFLTALRSACQTYYVNQACSAVSLDGFLVSAARGGGGGEEEDGALERKRVNVFICLAQRLPGLSIRHDRDTFDVLEVSLCVTGARDNTVLKEAYFSGTIPDCDPEKVNGFMEELAALHSITNIAKFEKLARDFRGTGVPEELFTYSQGKSDSTLDQQAPLKNRSTQAEEPQSEPAASSSSSSSSSSSYHLEKMADREALGKLQDQQQHLIKLLESRRKRPLDEGQENDGGFAAGTAYSDSGKRFRRPGGNYQECACPAYGNYGLQSCPDCYSMCHHHHHQQQQQQQQIPPPTQPHPNQVPPPYPQVPPPIQPPPPPPQQQQPMQQQQQPMQQQQQPMQQHQGNPQAIFSLPCFQPTGSVQLAPFPVAAPAVEASHPTTMYSSSVNELKKEMHDALRQDMHDVVRNVLANQLKGNGLDALVQAALSRASRPEINESSNASSEAAPPAAGSDATPAKETTAPSGVASAPIAESHPDNMAYAYCGEKTKKKKHGDYLLEQLQKKN